GAEAQPAVQPRAVDSHRHPLEVRLVRGRHPDGPRAFGGGIMRGRAAGPGIIGCFVVPPSGSTNTTLDTAPTSEDTAMSASAPRKRRLKKQASDRLPVVPFTPDNDAALCYIRQSHFSDESTSSAVQ